MFSAMACDARLRCAQELILRVTLSFHMLAVALGPADRLDGRTLDVELLMTEWHRAFSLSIPIPIPIPIATPTPIALRRCLDSVVSVIHEPLLSALSGLRPNQFPAAYLWTMRGITVCPASSDRRNASRRWR
jgi:hypothetical protein